MRAVGSKIQVVRGEALATATGLQRADLAISDSGRVYSTRAPRPADDATLMSPVQLARNRKSARRKCALKALLLSFIGACTIGAVAEQRALQGAARAMALLRATAAPRAMAGASSPRPSRSLVADPPPVGFRRRPARPVALWTRDRPACPAGSWVGGDGVPRHAGFGDPRFTAHPTLRALLMATLQPAAATGRHLVHLAPGQQCDYGGHSTELGALAVFTNALLVGDVVADCDGPVVYTGVGDRPDRWAQPRWFLPRALGA